MVVKWLAFRAVVAAERRRVEVLVHGRGAFTRTDGERRRNFVCSIFGSKRNQEVIELVSLSRDLAPFYFLSPLHLRAPALVIQEFESQVGVHTLHIIP